MALDLDSTCPPSCATRSRRRSARPASTTATSRSSWSTRSGSASSTASTAARTRPTDVLAFPIDGAGPTAGPRELGDVAICPEHCSDVTEAAVHGVLHLCGYDHETDDGEMLALQARVLAGLAMTPRRLRRPRRAAQRRQVDPGQRDRRQPRRDRLDAPADDAAGDPRHRHRRRGRPPARPRRPARRAEPARRADRADAAAGSSASWPTPTWRCSSSTARRGSGPATASSPAPCSAPSARLPMICAVNKVDRLGPNELVAGARRRPPSWRASTRSSRSAPAAARAWTRWSSGWRSWSPRAPTSTRRRTTATSRASCCWPS